MKASHGQSLTVERYAACNLKKYGEASTSDQQLLGDGRKAGKIDLKGN